MSLGVGGKREVKLQLLQINVCEMQNMRSHLHSRCQQSNKTRIALKQHAKLLGHSAQDCLPIKSAAQSARKYLDMGSSDDPLMLRSPQQQKQPCVCESKDGERRTCPASKQGIFWGFPREVHEG
eukprot:3947264-Amphidinium_carterae.1